MYECVWKLLGSVVSLLVYKICLWIVYLWGICLLLYFMFVDMSMIVCNINLLRLLMFSKVKVNFVFLSFIVWIIFYNLVFKICILFVVYNWVLFVMIKMFILFWWKNLRRWRKIVVILNMELKNWLLVVYLLILGNFGVKIIDIFFVIL